MKMKESVRTAIVETLENMRKKKTKKELINFFDNELKKIDKKFIWSYLDLSMKEDERPFFFISIFPQAYQDYYLKENWINKEPVMQQALENSEPFFWQITNTTKERQKMFKVLKDFGIYKNGVTFNLNSESSYGLCKFSMSTTDVNSLTFEDTIKKNFFDIYSLVRGFHSCLKKLAKPKKYDFTRKELIVINSLLRGDDYGTIAKNLGVSRTTIVFHMVNIKNKVGVKTRAQLMTVLNTK